VGGEGREGDLQVAVPPALQQSHHHNHYPQVQATLLMHVDRSRVEESLEMIYVGRKS
jgi:hypothetical protein